MRELPTPNEAFEIYTVSKLPPYIKNWISQVFKYIETYVLTKLAQIARFSFLFSFLLSLGWAGKESSLRNWGFEKRNCVFYPKLRVRRDLTNRATGLERKGVDEMWWDGEQVWLEGFESSLTHVLQSSDCSLFGQLIVGRTVLTLDLATDMGGGRGGTMYVIRLRPKLANIIAIWPVLHTLEIRTSSSLPLTFLEWLPVDYFDIDSFYFFLIVSNDPLPKSFSA
jgi:hypothetical protein